MTLRILAATFDGCHLGMHGLVSEDGRYLRLTFDHLQAPRLPARTPGEPAANGRIGVAAADGIVRFSGLGWACVRLLGQGRCGGPQGLSMALLSANGQMARASPGAHDGPCTAALSAQVHAEGELQLTILVLARTDTFDPHADASLSVRSLEVEVI